MYINSVNNYAMLYKELNAQKMRIIEEFEPKLEEVMIDQSNFVGVEAIENFNENL